VNDNARLQRIRLVLETLDLQEIQHFQLPTRSPEFNPIETVRDLGSTRRIFALSREYSGIE
jgi:hypothetical protein